MAGKNTGVKLTPLKIEAVETRPFARLTSALAGYKPRKLGTDKLISKGGVRCALGVVCNLSEDDDTGQWDGFRFDQVFAHLDSLGFTASLRNDVARTNDANWLTETTEERFTRMLTWARGMAWLEERAAREAAHRLSTQRKA